MSSGSLSDTGAEQLLQSGIDEHENSIYSEVEIKQPISLLQKSESSVGINVGIEYGVSDQSRDDTNVTGSVNLNKADVPSMEKQRDIIANLLKVNENSAKEGDRMFIIPQYWYNTFLNTDITDTDQLEPINTSALYKDYNNFILNDFDHCPYLSIPETVFEKFFNWYGLDSNSKPITTVLICDEETDELITEYNRCVFRIHYLTVSKESRTQYRYHNNEHNNIVYFTASRISTVKDLFSSILQRFFEKESHLDIDQTKFKVWFVKDSEENSTYSILNTSYKLDPIQFMSFPLISRITTKSFEKSLRELRIFSGDFVIEIMQNGEKCHWLSNYFHYNQINSATGDVGLNNLGNTCYMNSALQCLVHIPALRDYLLYNGYNKEINLENPLGHQGHIAKSFASLVQNLFKKEVIPLSSFSPGFFKSTIGHFNSMFSGYLQQDSQEFLAFLLDGLHEDLNRVINKPYVEKPELSLSDDVDDITVIKKLAQDTWNAHLQRNNSIITDLFVGLYKSTLECPHCKHISITFDPFNDLTLPLPVDTVWSTKIKLFPKNSPPCVIKIEMEKTSTYDELKKYIAKCANMDADNLYGCEIFNHQFYNYFEASNSNAQYLPIKELISDVDDIIFYEITRTSIDDIIVPVLNTKMENGFKNARLFGVPFFLVLSKEEFNNPGAIRKQLEKCYSLLSGGFIEFPSLESGKKLDLESFPLLMEKYPETDFSKFQDFIRFSNVNDNEYDKYFKITLLDVNETQQIKNNTGINEDDKIPPEVWIPLSHINFNKAKDITTYLEPIVRDIYNYNSLNCQVSGLENIDINDEKIEDEVSDSDMSIDVEFRTEQAVEPTSEKDDDDESMNLQPDIITPQRFIICEWSGDSKEEVFSEDKIVNWERPAELRNEEIEDSRRDRQSQVEKKISLDDCLNLFSKREVLGMSDSWYCPSCKDHRQATKQIQLWSTPDILLIHLKRFENQSSFSDKIDDTVHFPIENLDLSKHLANDDSSNSSVYDLIAVDNHFGGLGGGHYTAYVKNFIDNKWYYFDDSRVSETVPERSVAGSAYLLFYMRRDENGTVSHEKLHEIIEESRTEYNVKFDEVKKRQAILYESNKTDAEDISDVDDESDSALDNNMAIDDSTKPKKMNNQIEEQSSSSRSTDYSLESLEVGSSKPDNSEESIEYNSGRRKLRLIKKKYKVSPADSPKSVISSDDIDEANDISVLQSESESDSSLTTGRK